MTAKRHVLTVICTAIAFALFFQANTILFSSLEFTRGVNWIFLPSGLRLACILVFAEFGAIGIVLGSIGMGFSQYYSGDGLNAVVAGVLSGASPLLAKKFSADFLYLNTDLAGLSGRTLLKVAAVFSIISPILHQTWYVIHGQTQDFLYSTAVMAVGDFTGTVVVLYCLKFTMKSLLTTTKQHF